MSRATAAARPCHADGPGRRVTPVRQIVVVRFRRCPYRQRRIDVDSALLWRRWEGGGGMIRSELGGAAARRRRPAGPGQPTSGLRLSHMNLGSQPTIISSRRVPLGCSAAENRSDHM
jgi:hypothetical protein